MKDLLNDELKQWTEVISDEEIEEFLDVSVSYIDRPSEQKAEEIQGFFFGDMANGLIEKLDLIKDKKHKNQKQNEREYEQFVNKEALNKEVKKDDLSQKDTKQSIQ